MVNDTVQADLDDITPNINPQILRWLCDKRQNEVHAAAMLLEDAVSGIAIRGLAHSLRSVN